MNSAVASVPPGAAPSPDPEGPVVTFTYGDFLYGPDTGIQKPRTLLRMAIQRKTAAAGHKVWEGHRDASLKIDSLTQGMGPTPPGPTRHQLAGRPLPTSGAPTTRGVLPRTWQSNLDTPHVLRAGDKADFVRWIAQHPRFSPADSPSHADWNQRFKRTSKAGLQFALQERGYQVHFVLPRDADFDKIVRESSSHPRHASAKYEAFYLDGHGGEVGPIEEKRITHAELRWLFRHKDDPTVKSNVQFWDYDPSDGSFAPVAAPWERDPRPWREYAEARSRKPRRNGDTYSIARDPSREGPASSRFVVARDGSFTALD